MSNAPLQNPIDGVDAPYTPEDDRRGEELKMKVGKANLQKCPHCDGTGKIERVSADETGCKPE